LRKARERAHIQEGLAVALDNVDEIIALIKASPTPADARRGLMARLWTSPTVAEMLARAALDATRPEGLASNTGCPRTATCSRKRRRRRFSNCACSG
jgi:DNA gyrase subunit A